MALKWGIDLPCIYVVVVGAVVTRPVTANLTPHPAKKGQIHVKLNFIIKIFVSLITGKIVEQHETGIMCLH